MITPDTKDWTWVLDRVCPECAYDAAAVDRARIGDLLRRNAADWAVVLGDPAFDPRLRPRPDVWSPVEYACHVRDCCGVYTERLRLMLTTDDPHYPNWDQDETAVTSGYASADPLQVAPELVAAAHELADRFDAVTGDQWARTGNRGDGARFTVDTFGRYFLHDPVHHVWDVTRYR